MVLGLVGQNVQAASPYAAPPKAADSKYQRPEDLLDLIPFLGEIPRTFLIGDGFKMRLSGQELRIDHMGRQSRAPASQRNCLIGLSYTTPVAGFFTSRVDLPLFHAATPKWEDWGVSSLGDYVVYLSRGATDIPLFRLVATARF
jgi:hypothetical protein